MSKSNLIAAIVLAVGLALHALGMTYTEGEQTELAHLAGGAFDTIAAVIAFINRKRGDGDGGAAARPAHWPGLAPVLLLALFAGGCASFGNAEASDEQRLRDAHFGFDSAATALTLAEISGQFEGEVLDQLHELEAMAAGLLDRLDAAYLAGDPIDFQTCLREFNAAVRDYRAAQRKAGLNDGERSTGGGGRAGAAPGPTGPGRAATPRRGAPAEPVLGAPSPN